MLLVIDKSGSMTDMPAHFDTDKWSAMKASVAAALTPMKSQLQLGLELYPVAGCDLASGGGVDVGIQPATSRCRWSPRRSRMPILRAARPPLRRSRALSTYFTKGAGAQARRRKIRAARHRRRSELQ